MAVSGKLGETVYANTKHGLVARKAPKGGFTKDQPAFTGQKEKAAYVSPLAKEINDVVKEYNARFKSRQFWSEMLSNLRREKLNDRFLLLKTLEGMEINPDYPLKKINGSLLTVKKHKKSVVVRLDIQKHPDEGQYKANCYDYQAFLFSWDSTKKPAIVQVQLSEWISMDLNNPEVNFQFKKIHGLTHWLLILRQRLAVDHKDKRGIRYVEANVAEGMQIVKVDSFDKEELALWNQRQLELAKRKPSKIEVDTRERKGVVTAKEGTYTPPTL